MAIANRTPLSSNEAKSQTSITSLGLKKLVWGINEVMTLAACDDWTRGTECVVFSGIMGIGVGVGALGINVVSCLFADYVTDWDIGEAVYPTTTMGLPICLATILGVAIGITERYKYKRSYNDDEAEESLKHLFSNYKKIPLAYWKAPNAFIEYPLTTLGYPLFSAGAGLAAGYLTTAVPGLMALAFDSFRYELSGFNIKNYVYPQELISATLWGILLGSMTGIVNGFHLGLVKGVEVAEEKRKAGIPTALQSTTRFLMETLPRDVHRYARNCHKKMLEIKQESMAAIKNNKWEVARETLLCATPADIPIFAVMIILGLESNTPQAPNKEQIYANLYKLFIYLGLPSLVAGHTYSFYKAVKMVNAKNADVPSQQVSSNRLVS